MYFFSRNTFHKHNYQQQLPSKFTFFVFLLYQDWLMSEWQKRQDQQWWLLLNIDQWVIDKNKAGLVMTSFHSFLKSLLASHGPNYLEKLFGPKVSIASKVPLSWCHLIRFFIIDCNNWGYDILFQSPLIQCMCLFSKLNFLLNQRLKKGLKV